jgi:uncharacterized phage protein (TIGR02220 family)
MDRGYVKLWRKSIDSGLLQNHQLWVFWSWCLMKASHKKQKIMVGMQVVELQPGQFVFGRKIASKELNISEQTIRTCLKKLKNLQNLTIQATNKFSVITITNWDTYQQEQPRSNQQPNQEVTSNQPTTNHKQECKTLKNDIYSRVVDYLNRKTGSNFKSTTKTTKQHIDARVKEGFAPEDFKAVIDHKCNQWLTDPEQQEYLRPQTLFSTKFESYLEAARRTQKPINGTSRKTPEQIEAEMKEALS